MALLDPVRECISKRLLLQVLEKTYRVNIVTGDMVECQQKVLIGYVCPLCAKPFRVAQGRRPVLACANRHVVCEVCFAAGVGGDCGVCGAPLYTQYIHVDGRDVAEGRALPTRKMP